MAARTLRTEDKDWLARFLGWFSLGLGTAQLAAPRAMSRLIGADDNGRAPTVMRVMGVRELTQGVGILVRPRPTAWLWSRVAGDAVDLSLLGLVAARSANGNVRTAIAGVKVLAVTATDVAGSMRLSRKDGQPQKGKLVRKAVTINRPRTTVEDAWRGEEELARKIDDAGAFVAFDDAPGNRGTEVAVELIDAPPLGDLGLAALKLTGQDLATELSDDLRRFKQRVEAGEVVRSESTPGGHALGEHVKQRPAQPLEAVR